MPTVQEIINEWRSGRDAANQANQQRLDDILGLLQGQGESAKDEARRASGERTAGGDQSLMDRGLFNTTILDANRRREGEAVTRETNRIDENVALNKAGVLERVTDTGPDDQAFMNLLMTLGQSQGQGGRSHNFAGINRPGGSSSGGGGGNGSGGGGRGSGGGGGGSGPGGTDANNAGVVSFSGSQNRNPNDPFANQSLGQLQQNAQQTAGGNAMGPNGERYFIMSGTYGSGWSNRPPTSFLSKSGNTYYTR